MNRMDVLRLASLRLIEFAKQQLPSDALQLNIQAIDGAYAYGNRRGLELAFRDLYRDISYGMSLNDLSSLHATAFKDVDIREIADLTYGPVKQYRTLRKNGRIRSEDEYREIVELFELIEDLGVAGEDRDYLAKTISDYEILRIKKGL